MLLIRIPRALLVPACAVTAGSALRRLAIASAPEFAAGT
jgi:hypothetical protein